jgi:hypothetical protein
METILRLIGDLFLHVADAMHEAKNTANSFFLDILLVDKDFFEGR